MTGQIETRNSKFETRQSGSSGFRISAFGFRPILDMTPLAESLAEYMTAADVLGRVRMLIEAAKLMQINPMGPLATESFNELLGFESVKPQDSIDFLKSLTAFTKKAYEKLFPPYRLAAFTVAKVENLMLIERLRDLLAESLDRGWTQQEFINRLNAEFDAAGVTRMNPYHLDTVYQTNMQTAYMNGRIMQMSHPAVVKALPWWRYRTMEDELVRPNHAALNNFIARATDPVWGSISPPNGYRCRCELESLLDREARPALGARADIPGGKRLPPEGRPDEGFEQKPSAFLRQLESGKEFCQ